MPSSKYYGRGHENFANLPQKEMITRFPEAEEGLNVHLDDTARGIDAAIEFNTKYMRSHLADEKY